MTCPPPPKPLAKILGRIASRVQRSADAATCTAEAQQYAVLYGTEPARASGSDAERYYSFRVVEEPGPTEMLFDGRCKTFAGQLLCYWEVEDIEQVMAVFEQDGYEVAEKLATDPKTIPGHTKPADRVLLRKGNSLVGLIINPPYPFMGELKKGSRLLRMGLLAAGAAGGLLLVRRYRGRS